MPNTRYNLLDDDGLLYAVQYIFTKLSTSPLNVNTTYAISLNTTDEYIVLTGSDGTTTHVSYSDFGEQNVLEGVQINGTDLTITNKKVNIPYATDSVAGVMTDTDHTKLSGIASGAQVNVVESVKVDGTALTPDANKAVNIPAAGANTRGVMSQADVNTLISAAIAYIVGIRFVKVGVYANLPTEYDNTKTYAVNSYCLHDNYVWQCNTAILEAENWTEAHWTKVSNVFGTFFLVSNSGSAPNIYDEYIYVITDATTTPVTYGYELIGTTAVDLSGYVQYTDISLITNQEIADIVDDAYDAVFNPTTP